MHLRRRCGRYPSLHLFVFLLYLLSNGLTEQRVRAYNRIGGQEISAMEFVEATSWQIVGSHPMRQHPRGQAWNSVQNNSSPTHSCAFSAFLFHMESHSTYPF
uniref:Secreted protein n=1 Tax=Mesocestoides corti TaxID=53468 RepID=A0A5K3F894_MESCO